MDRPSFIHRLQRDPPVQDGAELIHKSTICVMIVLWSVPTRGTPVVSQPEIASRSNISPRHPARRRSPALYPTAQTGTSFTACSLTYVHRLAYPWPLRGSTVPDLALHFVV